MSFTAGNQAQQGMVSLTQQDQAAVAWASKEGEQGYAQQSFSLHGYGQAVVDPRAAPPPGMTWSAYSQGILAPAAPVPSTYPSLWTHLWDDKARRAPFGGSSMPTRPLPQTVDPTVTYTWIDDVAGPCHTWETIYRGRAERGIDPFDPTLPQRPAPTVTPPPTAVPSGNGGPVVGPFQSPGHIHGGMYAYVQQQLPAGVTHVWPSALTWSQGVPGADRSVSQGPSRNSSISSASGSTASISTPGSMSSAFVPTNAAAFFPSLFSYEGEEIAVGSVKSFGGPVDADSPPPSATPSLSNSHESQISSFSNTLVKLEPESPHNSNAPEIRRSARTVTVRKVFSAKAAKYAARKAKARSTRPVRPASTATSTSESERSTSYGSYPFACPHCKRRFARKYDMSRHIRQHTGESPYQCPACSERFVRNDRLRRHLAASAACAKKAPSVALYAYGVTGPRLKTPRELQLVGVGSGQRD